MSMHSGRRRLASSKVPCKAPGGLTSALPRDLWLSSGLRVALNSSPETGYVIRSALAIAAGHGEGRIVARPRESW